MKSAEEEMTDQCQQSVAEGQALIPDIDQVRTLISTKTAIQQAAFDYAKAGLSILPVRKSKAPLVETWKSRQSTRIGPELAASEFSGNGRLLAVIAGAVSGNLEFIDFDAKGECFKPWLESIKNQDPQLVKKLVIERSPSGGYHVAYRCRDSVSGNTKLAAKRIEVPIPGEHEYKGKRFKARKEGDKFFIVPDLIETRGEGGYCVTSPSSGYKLLQGDYRNPPEISCEERKILIDTARSFNEWIPQDALVDGSSRLQRDSKSKLPGDDFNQHADPWPILEKHGWKKTGQTATVNGEPAEYLMRPGKDRGNSATLIGGRVFYNFSTNAYPFEPDKAYFPFAIYAILEHNGDYQQAARELSKQGYGDKHKDPIALEKKKPEKPIVLGIADFLAYKFPPRRNLLAPWLPVQGLAMVYAFRGIGKTFLALHIGYAVASGGRFLNWQAPDPTGVLYLDGEMPGPVMQERLAKIVDSNEMEPTAPFQILTPDLQPNGMLKIDAKEGQMAIESVLSPEIGLIIVDNISTLTSAKENEADSWTPVQEWALQQRAKGRTVLFIHHAGKSGAQRGTSRREDVLDTVIALRRPTGYMADQGAVFEVHFEKSRGIYGENVKPFEATLTVDDQARMAWAIRSVENSTYDRVVMLTNEGFSQKEVASELSVNKSTVSRHVKRAKAAGLICSPKGEN